jgi:hypothetical protein
VLLFALTAVLVGRPLVDPGRVLVAAGEASRQLPWRGALSGAPTAPPRPDLSDQAMAFYPVYRFVSESWRRDLAPPLWNPLVHAGVPCLANPQWGALDPQVLLHVLLDALGGKPLFDWGFALLAWLRLGFAGWGAWLLARRLGLSIAGCACAAIGFASSGFSLAWLGFSVGHVTPLLPWLLLAVESTRTSGARAPLGRVGLACALSILAGHPETSFFDVLAASFWALAVAREDRRAGARAIAGLAAGVLASACMVVPFVEYLGRSAALEAHRAASALAPPPDLVALGGVLLLVGVVLAFAARPSSLPRARRILECAIFVGAALALLAMLGASRLGPSWMSTLLHDVYGSPEREGGYHGPASFGEVTSAWLATPVLVLALAAVLGRGARLARKALVACLAFGALALVLRVPAISDAWRVLPLVGQAAGARAGAVAALGLALLAGAALERAERLSRITAGLVIAGAAALLYVHPRVAPLPLELRAKDAREELVRVLRAPPEILAEGTLDVAGWIHPALAVDSAHLALFSLDERGRTVGDAIEAPVEVDASEESARDPLPGAERPEGARSFASRHVDARHLEEGNWRVDLVLERAAANGGRTTLGSRVLGTTCVMRTYTPAALTLALAALGLLLAMVSGEHAVLAAIALAVVLAQGLRFAISATAWTPSAEVFPATETAALLRSEQGFARVLGGPGVLPYDTGLADGLRVLDGYDALDVASFDAYRPYALRAGAHPILDWNARGVDLESPAFRLLGAHWLALADPLDAPGWELVAAPSSGAPRRAECYVYRALSPLPRVFCVRSIVPREQVLASLRTFDPLASAFLEPDRDLVLDEPFVEAHAEILELENERVRVRAELDGRGLLVLTEQSFPGWSVRVDGAEQDLLTVDALYRGVVLEPGAHEVVFCYRPVSFRAGLWLACAGSIAIAASFLLGKRG